MSFLSKFDSFFSGVGHFLKEVFGDESIEAKVSATLTLLTPAAVAIANLAGGPGASALVSAAVSQFKEDYSTLCTIVQGSFPAPGSSAAQILQGVLGSLQSSVGAILTDTGVKNSKSFSSISTYATFFMNETSAILLELEGASAPAPAVPAPGPSIVAPAPTKLTATVTDAPETKTTPNPTVAETPEVKPAANPSVGTGGVQKMI